MFEMSNDYTRINTKYEVVGGCKIFSHITTQWAFIPVDVEIAHT